VEAQLAPEGAPQAFARTVGEVRSAYIYWGQEDAGIRRANLDGTGQKVLVSGFALGPTLDVEGGKMYWGDPINGVIRRANLDGTGLKTLISGMNGPGAPALDLAAGLMY
jgi:hypothetical protein